MKRDGKDRTFPGSMLGLSARRWFTGVAVVLELLMLFSQLGIALFAPADLMDNSWYMRKLAGCVGSWVPALSSYNSESKFPQVSVAFYSISFLLLPFQVIVCAAFNYVSGSIPGAPAMHWKYMFLGLLLIAVCFVSLLYLPKDYTLVGAAGPNSTRLGLAFFGVGQFLCIWITAGAVIAELALRITRRTYK